MRQWHVAIKLELTQQGRDIVEQIVLSGAIKRSTRKDGRHATLAFLKHFSSKERAEEIGVAISEHMSSIIQQKAYSFVIDKVDILFGKVVCLVPTPESQSSLETLLTQLLAFLATIAVDPDKHEVFKRPYIPHITLKRGTIHERALEQINAFIIHLKQKVYGDDGIVLALNKCSYRVM